MTVDYYANTPGYSTDEIRSGLLDAIQKNNFSKKAQSNINFLFREDMSDKRRLLFRVRETKDPHDLEELARILFDPSIYYYQGKFYTYGSEEDSFVDYIEDTTYGGQ